MGLEHGNANNSSISKRHEAKGLGGFGQSRLGRIDILRSGCPQLPPMVFSSHKTITLGHAAALIVARLIFRPSEGLRRPLLLAVPHKSKIISQVR